MPIELSDVTIEEKNKLGSDSAFLVALEITIPGTDEKIRVVNNTENILWNGYTWIATQFELDDIRSSMAGESPRVDIRVDNTQKVLEYYIHTYEAWCKLNYREPITCVLYVINSKNQERVVSVNGTFEAGATEPYHWEIGASGMWEETLADAWVGAGILGSKCVRTVQTTGRSNVYLRETARIDFTPPYPTAHSVSYWRKGESIAEDGGTAKSRMRSWIGLEDDTSVYRNDPDESLPLGESDWTLREYSHTETQGIKWIWPFYQTVFQTGTAYVDNISVRMIWNNDAEVEHYFELIQPKSNPLWMTFTLGAANPFNRRYPSTRLIPVCPWKFKGPRCLYAGAETTCNKSYERCRALGNTIRFRGFFVTGKAS